MLSALKFILPIMVGIVTFIKVASPVSAATHQVSLVILEGQLWGARNVLVNGQFFDVDFVDGSCPALFSGCDEASDFDWGTDVAGASAAAVALMEQVFLDVPGSPQTSFDGTPSLTNGCDAFSFCRVYVPTGILTTQQFFGGDGYRTFVFENRQGFSADPRFETLILPTENTVPNTVAVFSRWYVASNPPQVPVPASVLTLITAVLVLPGVQSFKRRRAAVT